MRLDLPLIKTESGFRELHEREVVIQGRLRMLLVMVDGTKTAHQLLTLLHGTGQDDIDRLISLGLIEEQPALSLAAIAPLETPVAKVSTAEHSAAAISGPPALVGNIGPDELYTSLTAMCREQFGLIRGIKYSLEIERASGITELWAIAHRMLGDINSHKGLAAERRARRLLGLQDGPGP